MRGFHGMNELQIRIQTLEDAKEERKIFPEIKDKDVKVGSGMSVGIMEGMTKSGKCGVSFVIHHEDGTHSTFLITERNMIILMNIFRGALARFEELKAKRN